LTTENFPDLLLLPYEEAYYSSIFFLVFNVLAIFYLESILLSIVFDNYKKRIEAISERKLE